MVAVLLDASYLEGVVVSSYLGVGPSCLGHQHLFLDPLVLLGPITLMVSFAQLYPWVRLFLDLHLLLILLLLSWWVKMAGLQHS